MRLPLEARRPASGDQLEMRLPDVTVARRAGGGRGRVSAGVALLTMLAFPTAIRMYVAVGSVDMRKSFNGLT
jgi:hypothetical protein